MKRTTKRVGRKAGRKRTISLPPSPSWQEAPGVEAFEVARDEQPSAHPDEVADKEKPDEEESPSSISADDALGMYLRQMGAIPLLNRQEELELARHLEVLRRRYRRAVLCDWGVIAHVLDTFERVRDGALHLERMIDVVPSLNWTTEQVRERLPHHLLLLRRLLTQATAAPRQPVSVRAAAVRARRRAAWSRLRQAIALVEELSPRTELLDAWVDELKQQAGHEGTSAALPAPHLPPLATTEELARLLRVAERRRTRYQQVRCDLAQANLRLVVALAKRYRGRGLSFGDLIQEGNSGLMRAVDKFDHRLGFKFGTYATWWVRQGITRALADHARTIRVPCHQAAMLAALDRVRGELAARLGRQPAEEELATALNITPEEVHVLSVVAQHPVSLDEAFAGDNEQSWAGYLSDRSVTSPGEETDRRLLTERIAEVLRCLPPREREVIELRYGLQDGRPRTLDEIARMLGVTRERIRQIEARGLLRLRQPERSEQLADFAGVN